MAGKVSAANPEDALTMRAERGGAKVKYGYIAIKFQPTR
jgi:hypothetical protein